MARALWLRDILEDLRHQGVPVHYVPGWETRGSTTFDPKGIICHDTGGSATSTDAGEIRTLLNGSTSAPAPIAQLYLSRTTGVHLVAAGRCNHALTGKAGPLKGLGNSNLIGIEAAANPGRPWPPDQYRWYVLLVAALCRRRGWNPQRHVAAHREHQPGQKIDPAGIDLARFRADITRAITNPTTQGDDVDPLQIAQINNAERYSAAIFGLADNAQGISNTQTARDVPSPFTAAFKKLAADVAALKDRPSVDPAAVAAAMTADVSFITQLAAAVAAQVTLQAGATVDQVRKVVDEELDEAFRGGADTD
jgi:hypothetical protein